MKKFTTKTLLALACVAVAGMQVANADALMTGHFSGGTVLTGSGAVISGHTEGLTNITGDRTNNATLHFNDHTRIDWTKLNVDKDQTLRFDTANKGYAILNNVLTGASKFAGKVTADNAKVIIANPNGILFNGGSFESTGSLILTTRDLTGVSETGIDTLKATDLKDMADSNNQFNVVMVQDGSIKSGDLNIVSDGTCVINSDLTANDVVYITSDGANYVAKRPVGDSGVEASFFPWDSYVNKDANDNPTKVSNNTMLYGATIKSANGNVEIVSDNSNAMVSASTLTGKNVNITAKGGGVRLARYNKEVTQVNGNLNVVAKNEVEVGSGADNGGKLNVTGDPSLEGTRVCLNSGNFDGNLKVVDNANDAGTVNIDNVINIKRTNVGGDLTIDSEDYVYIYNTNAGKTDIDAKTASLSNVTLGETDIKTLGYTGIGGNSTINGNLTVDAGRSIQFGSYSSGTAVDPETGNQVLSKGSLDGGSVTINGNLDARADHTIGISVPTTVSGKAKLRTENSSVVYAEDSNGPVGTLTVNGTQYITPDGNNLVIEAPKSLNELLPLSSEIDHKMTLAEYNEAGTTAMASSYFEEMQRDYVQHRDPDPKPKPDPDPDPSIKDEPVKNLTNLIQNGVDAGFVQTFTPIAFAADEEPDVVKRIAKIVFKTPDGIVSISDRLIQKDINSSF